MGRKAKVVEFDYERFAQMDSDSKLQIISDYEELHAFQLAQMPSAEIFTHVAGKAEDIAESHFTGLGYEVYRSRVNDGYRCIGVEFYWTDYAEKLSHADKMLIDRLKSLMSKEDFFELAMTTKDKSGTPDLLLIKDGKLSFVEVKAQYETVKLSTIKFFTKYGSKWPISVLRVRKGKD